MATVVVPGIISAALHICNPGDSQVLYFLYNVTGLHAALLCRSDVNDVI